ncbi:hypothetical protein SEA_LEONARD_9 [Gordonia phage Leonard]|uniref:Helix-turn-helix DNA binding domain protein n=2 Tax=Leonardvirus TaxID=2948800 RepID=A0A649VM96_9CAUD|nr:hypothetical protein BI045_gp09 [Gordonia phage Phinally]YP_010002228.1 hypothetical protein J1769_gp09 [Gordonia phage Leonard]YP_010002484.1 hypothetical protein J1772_gp07 [Gordonia phage Ali17]AMS03001.1 hypothetical protein SEA_PHINALLY_9 [Gordonia phage Phinally]AXQ60623.1 hypothetical protein SEA_ALI17_7 [Gordonia phage Ali17]QGJ93371.1 hypothetical protein SEA_LEONARD_9 [Gordonia phage Leonard]
MTTTQIAHQLNIDPAQITDAALAEIADTIGPAGRHARLTHTERAVARTILINHR